MTAVFVCSLKDIVCGEIPANWCDNCPRKHVMVPVAPHAAAGPYPTAMRQATAQEHEWLMAGVRRASKLVPHPDTKDAERYRWLRDYGWGIYCDVFNDEEAPNLGSVEANAVRLDTSIDRQVEQRSRAHSQLSVNARRAGAEMARQDGQNTAPFPPPAVPLPREPL